MEALGGITDCASSGRENAALAPPPRDKTSARINTLVCWILSPYLITGEGRGYVKDSFF